MSKNVFIVGITGCIGGSVFVALKQAHPAFTYTALARDAAHFPAIAAAGATPVLGTFADRETIAGLAYEADVVVNCGQANDLGLSAAILEGLKRRRSEGRAVGVLVQTSGASVFMDETKEGRFGEGAGPVSDGNVENIKGLKDKLLGQFDLPILQASLAGDVHSYIIAPSGVHGTGTGPVGRTSAYVKLIGGAYLNAGRAFVVGEGSNVFGYVNISDLASLYLLVFNHALSFYPSAPPSSPYERYYICNALHRAWIVTAELFAESLHRRGKLASPEVAHVAYEEAGPLAIVFGSNTFTKEERGPALGWVRSGASLEETFERDLDAYFPPS